jgi:ribosomal subunit interface protein
MPPITIKASPKSLASPSVAEYIEKRIGSLDKMLREENTIHVEFDSDRHNSGEDRFHAEVTIGPGSAIFAEAYGSDVFEAIDLCIPKLKEQFTKRKDKRVAERRRLGADRKEQEEITGFGENAE